ncbi:putative sex pilus assembly and mating pair protein TraG [Legionella quinlivanii]|uniref:Putative sex pilus assembly and mating pair protein TraG n=1 Tax=Legionella quinlivanii TaxID=45073 RepID=A0A0W0XSM2_9GAMM|nr:MULTISPECIES: conjugal transfer protein TraG N-terminal domain-containing protein [Legionella]KTD47454.1 putative sex pilus assembly and mating pair protein TraG [Legionella quinlivanii]MCE3043697.1 conjugal transfer protein TraG N-terminal domain-containing protein [Legionella sp. 16cNR16C]SEG46661.1 conjugal transfer mating pair stabilization protein TraG [Legionella quinlivanii DSM 21216]STY49825.1 putative sex pilus assembly and mating pair protein TraG [Legionella quinlivanii]
MSLLTIYTPQNGEYLKTVLDAMVTLLGTSTYQTAQDIVSILAVGVVGFQYVTGKKIQAISRYVLCTFFLLFCILGLKVPVAIVDMQTADSAGSALTVDNVPLGVGLPAAIISGIGYGITKVSSNVLHMPDDLDYTKTGMLFGARTWLAASSANLSLSPELSRDLSAYIRQCIFSAKLLGSQQITPNELKGSADLIQLYFAHPSPIYRVLFHDGSNLSCIEAAEQLKPQLNEGVEKQLVHLSQIMTQGNQEKFSDGLAAAHSYFMNVSKDAANILTQNILINATRDSALDAFAFAGADAELMNYTNTSSLQKMHVAEANSFWLAGYRLPYYMTVFWMLTLCIFPLVMLLALVPAMHGVYMIYLQTQVFLWSWPPMFIIIHFFVSLASATTLTLFGAKNGGVTFSTVDSIASIQSSFAYTAGGLAISVPVIALFIAKGLPNLLSAASQHLGGMAQSLSTGEAQSATQGNISMASYSGWNMNYDNTHAHKWDTNFQHMEGRATVQAANGALLSAGTDGSRVINAQPAISQMATRLHASDRISASLQENASQSFHNAETYRTTADSHLQQAFSGLSQFSETDGNEVREGTGINKTLSNALNQDIRQMQDAVNQYNQHHDKSGQVSIDAAVAARIDTRRGILGSFAHWTTGLSGEASVSARAGTSQSNSVQAFFNSSEGQSFSNALNHMEATAKTHHLDANDSFNLSKSEQIAANLSQGQALSDMASTEYSKGENYQHMANQVKEHSSSMDRVLDQTFHDWVVQRHGVQGEQWLLGGDAASLSAQQKLADEFMGSTQGKSAIKEQVGQWVKPSSAEVRSQFEAQRDALRAHQQSKINQAHASGSSDVLDKSQERHLSMVQDNALQQAHELRMENREDLSQTYQNQSANTQKSIHSTQSGLTHRYSKQKQEYVDNNRYYKEENHE